MQYRQSSPAEMRVEPQAKKWPQPADPDTAPNTLLQNALYVGIAEHFTEDVYGVKKERKR